MPVSHRNSKNNGDIYISCILGVLAFLLVVGVAPLDPQNISWLDGGFDPTQHYIGWIFFRASPWLWPLGLSPNFGMEYSSSIVYSDSIPIFAFVFKFLSPWLSQQFQYFGIWYLFCFVLQAVFANLCLGLFAPKASPLIKFTCIGILLFSPPMLWRIGLHAALAAHFLILATIYLIYLPCQKRKVVSWVLLLGITALIHLYLLAILSALWIATLADDVRLKKVNVYYFGFEVVAVLISQVFLLWQVGFFEVGALSSTTGDYGVYGLGLFSFLDSQKWSYILPSVPGGTLESFNYLGLGVLLLGVFLLASAKYRFIELIKQFKHRPYLYSVIGCLCLFAISNTIRIGGYAFTIPLPQEIFSLASIFRASARMVWPLYYLIVLGILCGVIKFFSARTASWLLITALIIQVVDTSAGWTTIRRQFAQASQKIGLDSPLNSPFWAQAAKKYDQVINTSFPSGPPNLYIGWQIWANYASQNGMRTNSAWLSRYDSQRLKAAKKILDQEIESGIYKTNALYIVREELLIPVYRHINLNKDLITRVNGFIVLAPGWKNCSSCMDAWSDELILPKIPIPKIGQEITFGKGASGALFLVGVNQYQIQGWGWAFPEGWGVWSEGDRAKLSLPLPEERAQVLRLKIKALIGPSRSHQRVQMLLNGVKQGSFSLTASEEILELKIPKGVHQDYILIEFVLPDHISPKALGLGGDERKLSIGLISAIFQ